MECPNCKTDMAAKTDMSSKRKDKAVVGKDDNRTPAPDDALRADRPPAPCPQCGWSTMWNE